MTYRLRCEGRRRDKRRRQERLARRNAFMEECAAFDHSHDDRVDALAWGLGAFDPEQRAREKQASRDEDARRLAAGEVTPEELTRENSIFHGMIQSGRLRIQYKP